MHGFVVVFYREVLNRALVCYSWIGKRATLHRVGNSQRPGATAMQANGGKTGSGNWIQNHQRPPCRAQHHHSAPAGPPVPRFSGENGGIVGRGVFVAVSDDERISCCRVAPRPRRRPRLPRPAAAVPAGLHRNIISLAPQRRRAAASSSQIDLSVPSPANLGITHLAAIGSGKAQAWHEGLAAGLPTAYVPRTAKEINPLHH